MNPIAIAAAKALIARCNGPMTPARVRSILAANGIGASDEDIAQIIKPPPKKKAKTKKVTTDG
jgi:hypothetical protein